EVVSASDVLTSEDGSGSGSAVASDVDGDTLRYHLVDTDGNQVSSLSTDHGTVTIDSATGEYTFTPNAEAQALGVGAVQSDTFKVVATDGTTTSEPTTVGVTITGSNDGPIVSGAVDLGDTAEDNSITFTKAQLLANASDVDGDSLSVSNLTSANGTITENSDGTYTFTPAENFSGSVDVSYTVSDGQGGTTAGSASLDVSAVADQASVSLSIGEGAVDTNGSFTVTNHDGSAGYHNTYGYYVMDENGNPTSGEIIWKDVHDTNGQSVTIEGVDPDQVGFFIIPNGDQNSSIRDGSDVTFTKDSAGNWQVVDSNGAVLSGTGTKVLFDNKDLNSDDLVHMQDTSRDGGNQNWEDLNGGGDRDYNDLNMTVEWGEAEPTSTHEVNIAASFPDMDGSEGHTVVLNGLPEGATLYQDGVALVPGADGSYTLDASDLDGLTLTTAPGFSGEIELSVTATSADGASTASASAQAEVNIDLGNTGPDAGEAESVSTAVNNAVTGQVEATDADGNDLNFSLATGNDGPQHGSVALNPDGTFTYTPTGNFSGTDTFKVVIDDGHGGTTTETVSVTVENPNHRPVAGDDSRIDDDAQGPALSVSMGTTTVETTTTGTSADVDWNGLDTMSDPTTATPTTNVAGDLNTANNGSNNADVISIGGDNNASISTGNGDDQVTIGDDVNAKIDLGNGTNALDMADDVNASVSGGSGNDTVRVGDDLNGNIDLGNGDNRLQVGGDANASISTGSGSDDVKIVGDLNSNISLGSGADDLQTGGDANASIDVGEGNDRVLVGDDLSSKASLGSGDDYLEVADDSWASIDAGSGNDTVKIGGDISSKVDMGSGNDRVTITGDNLWATVTGGSGTDSIELTGVTKAEWDANANGVKNYVKDFENIKFADGQVIGDASAFDTTTTTSTYKTPLTIEATLNDTDGSETLSPVTIGNIPAGATLELDGEVLTPNADGTYTLNVMSGSPVEVTLVTDTPVTANSLNLTTTVSSTEAHGGDVSVTTQVGVGSNAGETVADDRIATDTNRTVSIDSADLLANDTDADGDALSIISVGNAQHGTVSLGADGQVVFTADRGFEGTTTFEYTVSDGHGGTDVATVSVYVDDPNDAPVINAAQTTETLSVDYSEPNSSNIGRVSATDVNGDTLTYSVLDSGNQHGNLVIDSDSGSFFYNADDTSWSGTDTFTVQVDDGNGGLATQTISVQVTGGSGGGNGSGGGHAIGWGNGGGRDESWGANGSWSVGGNHSGGGHGNNGWGNGDQDAPGNSGDHNNAENDHSGGGRGHSGGGRHGSGGGRSGGGHGHGGWGHNSGGGNDGDVVHASDDGTNWSSGWRAVDVGNGDQDGTNDTISISGYNRHNESYNGDSGDTLIGAGGNDYMSLEGADHGQKISGFDHIQLGDGDNVILDMTTSRYDYGDLTVAGGTGHDVIWSASGDDLLVAGDGGNTIHGGAGDDTIVAGAGSDDLMGQDGSDLFLFDFGTGHDTVNGGAGGNWTDTIDLSTNMGEGASITISTGGSDWTVASDGDHDAAGTINLGQDKSGTITVHSQDGDQTIEFTNIESIKF
ncbi:Type V secretory pathway, adhesin AidA, partial [Paramagnetospirillum caucaseum]